MDYGRLCKTLWRSTSWQRENVKISLSRCFTSIGYAGLQAFLNTSLTKDRLVGFEVTSLAISVR